LDRAKDRKENMAGHVIYTVRLCGAWVSLSNN
jgi:hypothetical protein